MASYFPTAPLSGTCSVNSDFFGTLKLIIPVLPFPIVYDIVVANHGRAFDSIVASPQSVMVSTSGQRADLTDDAEVNELLPASQFTRHLQIPDEFCFSD